MCDNTNRKNRQQVFETKITAGQLLNIFGQLEDRLVKNYYPQNDELYIIQDIRDNTVDGERLAKEICEELQTNAKHRSTK